MRLSPQHEIARRPAPTESGSDPKVQHAAVRDGRTTRPTVHVEKIRCERHARKNWESRHFTTRLTWRRGVTATRHLAVTAPLSHQSHGPVLTLAPVYHSNDPGFTGDLAEFKPLSHDDRFSDWPVCFFNASRVSLASAVACTFPKCFRLVALQEKREWRLSGRRADKRR